MKLSYDFLNIDIVEDLRNELLKLLNNKDKEVTLDLQEVNKIDLAAIQLLISLQKTLQSNNQTLKLKNCNEGVVNALTMSGCDTLLGASID